MLLSTAILWYFCPARIEHNLTIPGSTSQQPSAVDKRGSNLWLTPIREPANFQRQTKPSWANASCVWTRETGIHWISEVDISKGRIFLTRWHNFWGYFRRPFGRFPTKSSVNLLTPFSNINPRIHIIISSWPSPPRHRAQTDANGAAVIPKPNLTPHAKPRQHS